MYNLKLLIGIDIGATWTRVALSKPSGEVLSRTSFKTPRSGGRRTVAEAIIDEVKRSLSKHLHNVEAIGVGTIGPLDLSSGIVFNAANLPIKTFDVAQPLMEELGKPVIMANDCTAAVWGEYVFGVGKNVENLIYVTISTGIGGGVIVDGNLLVGKSGNAHEIGHIVVDASGKMTCGCGGRGHWEAYSSGANMPRLASRLIEEWSLSNLEKMSKVYESYTSNNLSPELIYAEAKNNDLLALRILLEVNKYNAAGFESIINTYDPELITIGGSIALNNPELVIEPIVSYLKNTKGLLTQFPSIRQTELGGDIVLIGAIALAAMPPRNLLKRLKYLSEK
ncbi:MAG: ROK family protein [Sulfolobales archaeon]|nr:ROK family protein [Sulfolobales archaeon]MCX8199334.1 ROK family protein [Sulfolobales archaeon]MDW8170352.1 ROK family protein [Desulfurococcaceae archaeon]